MVSAEVSAKVFGDTPDRSNRAAKLVCTVLASCLIDCCHAGTVPENVTDALLQPNSSQTTSVRTSCKCLVLLVKVQAMTKTASVGK